MTIRNNSAPGTGYSAGIDQTDDFDAYAARVAIPTMQAVDGLPPAFVALANELGYVDVYRAWKRGLNPREIAKRAVDGVFHL